MLFIHKSVIIDSNMHQKCWEV